MPMMPSIKAMGTGKYLGGKPVNLRGIMGGGGRGAQQAYRHSSQWAGGSALKHNLLAASPIVAASE
jgi:hypothetical protein